MIELRIIYLYLMSDLEGSRVQSDTSPGASTRLLLIASSFLLRSRPQRLQGIDLATAADLPAPAFEAPALAVLAVQLLEGDEPDVVGRERLLALRRQEVVRHVTQVGLGARGLQLAVVPEVVQLGGVVLEEAREFLGLEKLLAELAGPRLPDGYPRHGAQGVVHPVPERVHLLHVEGVVADLLAQLRLVLPDPGQHLLVVFGRLDARGDVLAELVLRDRKREAHSRLPGPGRTAYPVLVALRGLREVEVDDSADVLEVYAARNAVLIIPRGLSLLFRRRIRLRFAIAIRFRAFSLLPVSWLVIVFVTEHFSVVASNNNIVYVPVELLDDVYPGAHRKLGI